MTIETEGLKALCDRLALDVTKKRDFETKHFAENTIQYIDENKERNDLICKICGAQREGTFNMNYICVHPTPQHIPMI